MNGSRSVLGVSIALALAIPLSAGAEETTPPLPGRPSAERGLEIAANWCSSCHLISPNQSDAPVDVTPSFMELATTLPEAEARYRAFLANPHTPMKEFFLSRQDIDDLLAYLATLRS